MDLDNKETLYKLELLIKKIAGKLVTKPEYLRARNKTAAILNMIYKRKIIDCKVLIKTFFESIPVKNLESLKNYPRKMFCVKDSSIIYKNKEKINIDKNLFDSIIYFYG